MTASWRKAEVSISKGAAGLRTMALAASYCQYLSWGCDCPAMLSMQPAKAKKCP